MNPILSFPSSPCRSNLLILERTIGKISQFEADAKLAKLARDRALLAGPFWQGPDVDSGAKMIKWIHRLVSFFEVAGVVLEIGSLIADAVVGSIVRDKMRT